LVAIESDTTDRSDSLHAIDPTTGNELWVFQPEAQEGVEIRSAAVAGKTVFIVMNKELHLIDLTNGSVIESHDLGSYAESIILADSICLVATTEEIVAFEESQ
jgi:outer membrane protein assembly factor BamB